MKIKRVEIIGFKSFVDKVSLDFQEGTTAILGPNGCGKSNVVDAIRWAMGEQNAKNLRGRSMEDIIFGGSESRRPLSLAEVNLVFNNEDGLAPASFRDYSEIMVTRRLYRSGESEYLLNKTPCRLLDITELFMDTGVGARAYSIIEQGKIGMILNAKPEDRRFLIEEAAGVTKFKSRKKSALRKIDATRQNLLRLGDIVSEVRRQLGSLKRQAQKAEKYREYREELKGIETRFAAERYCELAAEQEELTRDQNQRQQDLASLEARLSEGEARMEEMRLQQVTREKDAARGQEQVFHLTTEIQKAEGGLEMSEREIGNFDRQRERLRSEESDVVRRLEELQQEEQSLQTSMEALAEELTTETRRLTEEEEHAEEFSGREQEISQQLESARSELYALLTELSRIGSRQEEARRRIQTLQERIGQSRREVVTATEQAAESQGLLDTLEESLRAFRDRLCALKQEKEELQEEQKVLRRQSEEAEQSLLERRDELGRRRSRLESLQQLEKGLEGYGSGVRTLLSHPDFQQTFGTMVADILEVPEHLEVAVEAALGQRLQALLAENQQDILRALEFLKGGEGRCTFVLEGEEDSDSAEPVPGARPLAEEVRSRPGKEGVVSRLLSGIHLTQSLGACLATPLPSGAMLVTPEGETASFRGDISGGGPGGESSGLLHRKREMKELEATVERLESDVARLQDQRAELRDRLNETEEAAREVEGAVHREELKIVDSEKDLERLQLEASRVQERLDVLALEEDQLHGEKQDLEQQLAEADRGHRDLEQKKLEREEEVTLLQEQIQILRRDSEDVRERVTSMKVKVVSLREREGEARRSLERLARLRQELQGRTALLKSQVAEGEEEQDRLREEGKQLRTQIEVLLARREEEKKRYDKLRDLFEEEGARIEAQEGVLKSLRSKLSEARESTGALQLRQQELTLEAEHLRQTILDRYRIDLSANLPEMESEFDPQQAQSRLEQLRRLIDGIGEVNLTAIEEYRELEERYQFLTTQQEDLRQSLEGLQTAIGKINRTTRRRFRETFDQVNAKFREVFPRLFRGGQAELKLTDEEDLLETGIEIIVQPPGKKLQNVNLLSGGEKALTAVALIFSIFLIKPSPFCMLDEVDAPLDDANIGRFNEMIREMVAHSQFIIITHNKRTMEVADTLYGITMEEPGVSKVVSVRMNDFQV